jgi:hypothetical protein
MYNRSIYKVTIYLLFAIMFVEESKNVYQWRNVYQCVYFRVLFVVFLVETITQLTFLLGLDYLPTAQAVRVLDFTVVFSSIINVVGTIVGMIATDGNGSFLGIPLSLIIAVDSGITFGLIMIPMVGVLCSGADAGCFILLIAIPGTLTIIEVVVFLYACLFKEDILLYVYLCKKKKDDDLPCTTLEYTVILAKTLTLHEAMTGGVYLCLMLLISYQETLTHEQLYGNIPFLIIPLVYCTLKALGTGSLWIFGMFARSNNGEEESKKLLGDASMSTFRTF